MKIKYLYQVLLLSFLSVMTFPCHAEKQCVILLHGLARTHHSMSSIETVLKNHGYTVINVDYPSNKESIEVLSEKYLPMMINQCMSKGAKQINFVTHSMGGIVLEQYLQTHTIIGLSHIVMLGPPHHGSELADLLHDNWLFKHFTGPAGQELTTSQTSLPNTLRFDKHYQIGVIAGSYDFIPFNHYIFHDMNDGKVTVSSTKMYAMKDFIVLPVSHTFMMNDATVQLQILNFLADGKFIH